MKLSVIILNYNVRFFLELCLLSVSKALKNIDAEIIVVDNNSTDDSLSMLQENFSQIRVVKNSENVGFAKANNQGVAFAKGEYVCILNPDTVVTEQFFVNLLDFAQTKPNLGIVGCRLIDGSGKFLPESKRNIPTPKIAIKKLLGEDKNYYANHIEEFETKEVDVLVGAIMLIKKSVYETVSGFDEDYFMYAEDVDISYKVLKAGYKNFYLGTETIIHFKGESTIKNFLYLKRFYGSMQIFYKKHFRKNLYFDALVWLGIRVVPLLKVNAREETLSYENHVFISDKEPEWVKARLNLPLEFTTKLTKFQDNCIYIFDVSSNHFGDIMDVISNSKLKDTRFRFYIPDSKVIIGSDNAIGRGEIIQLKQENK